MKTGIKALILALIMVCGCMGADQPAQVQNEGDTDSVQTPKEGVSDQSENQGDRPPRPVQQTGDLRDVALAMATGLPYRCTYHVDQQTMTTWIKGQKYLVESETPDGKVYSINDAKFVYTWLDGEQDGFKLDLSQADDVSDEGAILEYDDLESLSEQAINVHCERENIPDSMFVPPKDIEFIDFGQMMAGVFEQSAWDMADPCGICDMIPDPRQREDCLADC